MTRSQHASYVFLLDGQGVIHPLPHYLYVALARGEASDLQFAGHTLRLVEWYVRLADGELEMLVNETYGLLAFDLTGRADWRATPAFHPHRPGHHGTGSASHGRLCARPGRDLPVRAHAAGRRSRGLRGGPGAVAVFAFVGKRAPL